MSGDADWEDGGSRRQGSSGWRRGLYVILLLLFLLPAAYYQGYVFYGRDMEKSLPEEPTPLQWRAWGALYSAWAPMRAWDARQARVQYASQFDGRWVGEDGSRLRVELEENGRGLAVWEGEGEGSRKTFAGEWAGFESAKFCNENVAMILSPDEDVFMISFGKKSPKAGGADLRSVEVMYGNEAATRTGEMLSAGTFEREKE